MSVYSGSVFLAALFKLGIIEGFQNLTKMVICNAISPPGIRLNSKGTAFVNFISNAFEERKKGSFDIDVEPLSFCVFSYFCALNPYNQSLYFVA